MNDAGSKPFVCANTLPGSCLVEYQALAEERRVKTRLIRLSLITVRYPVAHCMVEGGSGDKHEQAKQLLPHPILDPQPRPGRRFHITYLLFYCCWQTIGSLAYNKHDHQSQICFLGRFDLTITYCLFYCSSSTAPSSHFPNWRSYKVSRPETPEFSSQVP